MFKAVAAAALPALAAAARPMGAEPNLLGTHPLRHIFQMWYTEHGKDYRGDEYERRFAIFQANNDFVNEYNAAQGRGHTLKLNKFADLTSEEFQNGYLGAPAGTTGALQAREAAPTPFTYEDTVPAKSVDWRKKGAVTPVKNQGQCGSCWAFSTTGSLEGAWAVAGHDLVALSEQELVDCDTKHDMGCNGGLMDYAFTFVEQEGLTTEKEYPYHAAVGQCNTTAEKDAVVKIKSFADVPKSNEAALKKAITGQPVSVAIQANQQAFQFYHSGVFSAECGTELDHGVLAVGYGCEDEADEAVDSWPWGKSCYYIVKNSWGATWGEEGYIRLAMGKNNGDGQCGIAMVPSYPIVAKADE